MLLIGFVWVIVSTIASLIVGLFIPGSRWEDHGPTVMILTATGAFFAGTFGAVIAEGVLGYSDTTASNPTLGVALSILGAATAFAFYIVDVRKNKGRQAA